MATKSRGTPLRAGASALPGRSALRERAVRRPGRPSKFGRPGRVVALTLPEDALTALRQVDPDTGWAIVKLLERDAPAAKARVPGEVQDVELFEFGGRQSLIVVNRATMPELPNVQSIPLSDAWAFLALDAGRSMSDLELAVIDRLADPALSPQKRRTLNTLREKLATWRRDRRLRIRPQSIIVLAPAPRGRGRRGN